MNSIKGRHLLVCHFEVSEESDHVAAVLRKKEELAALTNYNPRYESIIESYDSRNRFAPPPRSHA